MLENILIASYHALAGISMAWLLLKLYPNLLDRAYVLAGIFLFLAVIYFASRDVFNVLSAFAVCAFALCVARDAVMSVGAMPGRPPLAFACGLATVFVASSAAFNLISEVQHVASI
ncbi:TPA: hypothetical protein R9Y59_000172 [Stenotrophomonas maltophilia]|nr:hypothetical protein [Stenotrophomonas maltophilia]HEF1870142.1 hypothetical protein [Stenotrophomonas maltophilia]HEF1890512.1 hypothetical protein [Stenotrophomonas maltophilia]